MFLFAEYFERHGLFHEMLRLPFAVLGTVSSRKCVASVHDSAGGCLVKLWDLSAEGIDHLPPFVEWTTDVAAIRAGLFLPEDFSPIEYEIVVPTGMSSRPPREDQYEAFYDTVLYSNFHRAARERWLYQCCNQAFSDPKDDDRINQYNKVGKYWHLWKSYMLDLDCHNIVAPELVYGRLRKQSSLENVLLHQLEKVLLHKIYNNDLFINYDSMSQL